MKNIITIEERTAKKIASGEDTFMEVIDRGISHNKDISNDRIPANYNRNNY